MGGDVVSFDRGASVRRMAAVERDRIGAILAAIDEVQAARVALMDDTLSEAGEYLALKRLTAAEEGLVTLVVDPGFRRYHQYLLKGLTDFAAGGA